MSASRVSTRFGRMYKVGAAAAGAKAGSGYFPSVTAVLGMIDKPGLIPWAIRLTLDSVRADAASVMAQSPGPQASAPTAGTLDASWLEESLIRASRVVDQHKKAAADFGTRAHDAINAIITQEPHTAAIGLRPAVLTAPASAAAAAPTVAATIGDSTATQSAYSADTHAAAASEPAIAHQAAPEPDSDIAAVVDGFRRWYSQCGIALHPAGDSIVYSRRYRFAGATDALGVRASDGALVVVDFKTSNSVHPTYALQLAAYAQAVREMIADGELALVDGQGRPLSFQDFAAAIAAVGAGAPQLQLQPVAGHTAKAASAAAGSPNAAGTTRTRKPKAAASSAASSESGSLSISNFTATSSGDFHSGVATVPSLDAFDLPSDLGVGGLGLGGFATGMDMVSGSGSHTDSSLGLLPVGSFMVEAGRKQAVADKDRHSGAASSISSPGASSSPLLCAEEGQASGSGSGPPPVGTSSGTTRAGTATATATGTGTGSGRQVSFTGLVLNKIVDAAGGSKGKRKSKAAGTAEGAGAAGAGNTVVSGNLISETTAQWEAGKSELQASDVAAGGGAGASPHKRRTSVGGSVHRSRQQATAVQPAPERPADAAAIDEGGVSVGLSSAAQPLSAGTAHDSSGATLTPGTTGTTGIATAVVVAVPESPLVPASAAQAASASRGRRSFHSAAAAAETSDADAAGGAAETVAADADVSAGQVQVHVDPSTGHGHGSNAYAYGAQSGDSATAAANIALEAGAEADSEAQHPVWRWPVEALVVRLDKSTGQVFVSRVGDVEAAFAAFKACLLLWNTLNGERVSSGAGALGQGQSSGAPPPLLEPVDA